MPRPKGLPKTGGRKAGTPNKVTAEVRESARQHGPGVIDRLVSLSQSDDEQVALAACRELLDRGYGRAPQAVMARVSHNAGFSWLDVLEEADRREKARRVIDVTPTN